MKRRMMAAVLAASMFLVSAAGTYAESDVSAVESLAEAPAEETDAQDVEVARIRFAKDYKEVYETLKSVSSHYYWYEDDLVDYAVEDAEMAVEEAAPAMASNDISAAKGSDTGADFSGTNVRTEGVDEADVVKTDGKYIYILRGHASLTIVKADGADLKELATIPASDLTVDGNNGAEEFFINGSRLHVICQGYADSGDFHAWRAADRITRVATYDISNPEAPVFLGEMAQDGSYRQARLVDGMLYLFTEWYPYIDYSSYEESVLTAKVGGEEVPADRICIPDIVTDADYLIVSSIDTNKPDQVTDYKLMISGAEQLYVSSGGIYAVNADYWSERTKTEIVKFTYGGGAILPKAAGTLRGTVNDTFSIDEYKGNLRVLTTYTGTDRGELVELIGDILGLDLDSGDRWTRHNALYVLDENMNRIGRLRNLAEGEEIKSARFFGDTAYFVTFRNTDPLFTADLSDPTAPKILGQLKIPGFSAYLHPMGSGLLAGLGYEAEEEFGSVTGVKLSLFDLTDPADVKEAAKTVLGGVTWLPALEDYKAIFADAGRKLIGFYCGDRYLVYSVTEDNTFERVLLYDFFDDDLQGDSNYDSMRGLYIGDMFYLAGTSYVVAFDMANGFEKAAVLRLS